MKLKQEQIRTWMCEREAKKRSKTTLLRSDMQPAQVRAVLLINGEKA